jgi:hypothetical protein
VLPSKDARATPALIRRDPQKSSATGERQGTFSLHQRKTQIVAELIGSDTAFAAGLTVRAYAPVLCLCRRLIDAGAECLIIRSIGQAARLEINSGGTGFIRHRAVRAASSMRQNLRGAA